MPKFRLPKINAPRLSRKATRLPRLGITKNPFAAGTSKIKARASAAAQRLGGAAALMAATPGAGYVTGALGGALGGPKGAAFGFSAGAALDAAMTARLAMGAKRRANLLGYLKRRGQRKTGVYKAIRIYQRVRKSAFSRHPNTRAKRAELLDLARSVRLATPKSKAETRRHWADTVKGLRNSKSYRSTGARTLSNDDIARWAGRSLHYRK